MVTLPCSAWRPFGLLSFLNPSFLLSLVLRFFCQLSCFWGALGLRVLPVRSWEAAFLRYVWVQRVVLELGRCRGLRNGLCGQPSFLCGEGGLYAIRWKVWRLPCTLREVRAGAGVVQGTVCKGWAC